MDYTRKNAWNNGGTFDNPDLLWYAKGVGSLQSRGLNEKNSWWFFAAIHGEYIRFGQYPGWNHIPAPPSVPTTPLPSRATIQRFWNQCQHQSWYFPPWHRGYLIAFEAHIRKAVVSLGGPQDWALPYWNYLGPDDQYKMPPAFAESTLPDGTSNPLFVDARYGPNLDRNIFIPQGEISDECQNEDKYTGNTSRTNAGYGGYQTGFNHGGGSNGKLEANPHNNVHSLVGGRGLMSYPGTAALDPIFYLHHCNIDRMWAEWNEVDGHANPVDLNWLKGPVSIGEREFVMPMPDNVEWVFTPEHVTDMDVLNYQYDPGDRPPVIPSMNTMVARMNKLGIPMEEVKFSNLESFGKTASELVGASEGNHQLVGADLATTVKLDDRSWQKVPMSFLKESSANVPDQVFVELENVKGTMDGNILNISVNGRKAGSVSLFGLLDASAKDGHKGGSGLSFTLEITDIVDDLHLSNNLDIGSLDIEVTPRHSIDEKDKIDIGRISIHREQI
ncbi:tyrosinase family protein [Flagellimonas pacifica]|uniref:Tyrosinase n=1 Tax=Flagellimonas pacifica TaxID=1247520 RepID=A0A285N1Q2_9FLAO|nr:tyrosinase family protein [Allomuricauda parva]SNZ01671.1 tyrosinase [Allomuricauda parva]